MLLRCIYPHCHVLRARGRIDNRAVSSTAGPLGSYPPLHHPLFVRRKPEQLILNANSAGAADLQHRDGGIRARARALSVVAWFTQRLGPWLCKQQTRSILVLYHRFCLPAFGLHECTGY